MRQLIWPILISLIFISYYSIRPIYRTGDRVRITQTIYSDPTRYATNQYIKLCGLKIYLPLFPKLFMETM